MKLLITGDWHLDTQKPENRTDDYFQTQYGKVKWIFQKAVNEGCHAILQPGDLFNSHKANDFLKQFYMDRILFYCKDVDGLSKPPYLYTIYGQHDLRFHSSDKDNTPLRVLEVADACSVLSGDNDNLCIDPSGIYLYGMNWGEEIPKRTSEKGVHILLMHKLVIEDTVGWEKDFLSADNVLRLSKHDIIVCGDNHLSFMREICDDVGPTRLLFNCGSLMRSKVDQIDHKPVVYTVNTVDLQWKAHSVPIKPFHDVMNVSRAQMRADRNEQLESFVDKLGGEVEISGLDFKLNVMSYCKQNDIDQETISFIEEVMS